MTTIANANVAKLATIRRLEAERAQPIPASTYDPMRELIHLIATELGMTPQHKKADRMTREELIEDVEFMRATGEKAPGVCRRLGQSAETLERRFGRAGRHDLARFIRSGSPA